MTNNPSYVAGTDLQSSRIVKLSATQDHTVEHTGAAEAAVGVTHEGSREAPIPGVTPLAALAGENVRIYGEGETCDVVAGGTITRGDFVTSDGNAEAVPATGTQPYIGVAQASAVAGELARIQVLIDRGG